jgi:D-alanyl-D-alanine carboxypeptidase
MDLREPLQHSQPKRTATVPRMKILRIPALGIALGSIAIGSLVATTFTTTPAQAEATILIDADSGKVLREQNSTYPWYPASTSKLMTLYVTLKALKDHRITPDTLFTVSRNAYMQAPTKMGYPIGTQITVDNAIKMMMVKSANDMAVLLAEGVSGSIDKFAELMTLTAQTLGMSESNFVNPNGLPADGQISSARDLAILARALIRDFPEDSFYWHIPAIQYGRRVVRNYNPLIGRYPGTDGMKTGFICASGFNLVATATRDNKHLIAVVLGAPSGAARAVKAAEMLESGFTSNPLAWLMPSLGTVDQLKPIHTDPPNLKDEMCGGKHRKRPASDDEDEEAGAAEGNAPNADGAAATDGGDAPSGNVTVSEATPHFSVLLSALRAPSPKNANLLSVDVPATPIVVYTGPTRVPGAPVPVEPTPKIKVAAHTRPKAKPAAKPKATP